MLLISLVITLEMSNILAEHVKVQAFGPNDSRNSVIDRKWREKLKNFWVGKLNLKRLVQKFWIC